MDDHSLILCSQCYDKSDADGFNAVIPKSVCADCKRGCLGYRVSRPATDGEATEESEK